MEELPKSQPRAARKKEFQRNGASLLMLRLLAVATVLSVRHSVLSTKGSWGPFSGLLHFIVPVFPDGWSAMALLLALLLLCGGGY